MDLAWRLRISLVIHMATGNFINGNAGAVGSIVLNDIEGAVSISGPNGKRIPSSISLAK